jgi:hypothetical protein
MSLVNISGAKYILRLSQIAAFSRSYNVISSSSGTIGNVVAIDLTKSYCSLFRTLIFNYEKYVFSIREKPDTFFGRDKYYDT